MKMHFIQTTPLAVSGLALALASLGNLLLPHGKAIYMICGVLSAAILCLFFLKVIFDFQNVKEDLKNPVILSSLPTSPMALMLLCVYIKPYIGVIAVGLWYLAVACHVLIMIVFAKRFVIKFSLQNVFPTWFVGCVGIVVASVTSPAMNAVILGQAIFCTGFALYLIVLPIAIYRIAKLGLPEPARPTIAIFTAPMNLCMAGYFSTFAQPNAALIYAMLTVSVMLYIYVTVKVLFLIRMKFYPTFAAMTFPYVINATAFKMANDFLTGNGYSFFSMAPVISEWMAIMIVTYVLVRYIIFFISKNSSIFKTASS
jgi:exfoliative toxin A/B